MGFNGYLVKNTSNNATISLSVIAKGGYRSNPNIQSDNNSYTDANGMLHRNVLSHLRSKLWVNTVSLTETQKKNIQKVFPSRTKVSLSYWNDEIHDYKTGDFYVPDITWVISRVDNSNNLFYEPIEITLIEY